MRFIEANEEGYGFEFNLREKQLLFKVLARYPAIPPAHHRLSRFGPAASNENQKLLEESLAAHRQETLQKVRSLIKSPQSFEAKGHGFRWKATRAEVECLLQALNEVRVGSWLALGSPNLQQTKNAIPTPENHEHYWAMDIAGGFEMIFVAVLSGELPMQAD